MNPTVSTVSGGEPHTKVVLVSFVVGILIAMAVATYGATYVLVRDMSEALQEDFGVEVKRRIEEHLDQLFSGKIAALGDQASQGILINTVMHPSQNTAALEDYLSQLQLLGEVANYALLSFEGDVIAASRSTSFVSGFGDWPTAIINGTIPSHVEVIVRTDNQELEIRYAVPVLYNNNREGVLVAQQLYNVSLTESALEHRKASFIAEFRGSHDELIGRIGPVPPAYYTRLTLDVPRLKTPVYLYVDQDGASEALSTILWIVFGITVGLVILFLLAFQRLGLRLFVEPQQRLAAAKDLVLSVNSRLTRANEELSQFAYRTSHDIRGPLTTIKGLASAVIEDLDNDQIDDVRQNVDRIQTHAERLDTLAGDILNLSRADLLDGEPKVIDLEEMCQKISQELYEVNSDHVSIACDVRLETPFFSQPIRIYQILENLISNAVKYHSSDTEDSFVRIEVTQRDGIYLITVEDNGLGIPIERHAEVFEMFKRFHPNISAGSGLGMSIIQKHVEQLGGDINFASSPAGTKFHIRLPLGCEQLQLA